ncbi:hypothetical protein BDR06DRAFT_119817 [Suillus hirtellus]|nr:hypothetical protein BDR06DRAFT_119817 [Suillus hirtellus]
MVHFSSLCLPLSTGGLAWGGFSVHIGAPLLQPSLHLGGLSVHIGAPPLIIIVLYFLRKDDTCSTIRYFPSLSLLKTMTTAYRYVSFGLL